MTWVLYKTRVLFALDIKGHIVMYCTKHQDIKDIRDGEGTLPVSVNFGDKMEVSTQFHVHTALMPDKEPPVPTRTPDSWAPKVDWTFWRREKSLIPIPWLSSL